MKQFSLGVGLVLLAFLAWRMVTSLSSDALGMGIGIVFGMFAGIPSALLVLASSRRQARDEDDDDDDTPSTVNVYITHNTTNDHRQLTIHPPAGGMPLLADRERECTAQRERRFVVVGEREEW